jgi:hypothetical protein
VTATDSSGLCSSEVFLASIAPPPPALANQTPAQVWNDGTWVDFALPSNTFIAASADSLHLVAYQVSGPNATGWLHFSSDTGVFSGNVPWRMSGTAGIEVTAFDNAGRAASDTFSVSFASGSGSVASGARLHVAGAEVVAFHS